MPARTQTVPQSGVWRAAPSTAANQASLGHGDVRESDGGCWTAASWGFSLAAARQRGAGEHCRLDLYAWDPRLGRFAGRRRRRVRWIGPNVLPRERRRASIGPMTPKLSPCCVSFRRSRISTCCATSSSSLRRRARWWKPAARSNQRIEGLQARAAPPDRRGHRRRPGLASAGERALLLRLLLASADVRLAAWKCASEWQPLRRSQLQESLSHDAEQRELGVLVKAMDGPEFADYVRQAARRACVG